MEPAEDAEERKQRRKLQNRLNQRTRRSRLREHDTPARTHRRPYQVDKWRYTYQDPGNTSGISTSVRSRHLISSSQSITPRSSSKELVLTNAKERYTKAQLDNLGFRPPSPAQDHLLHLIHLNVLRGLFDNKLVLLALASYLAKCNNSQRLQLMPPEQVLPGRAAIMSTSTDLPRSLCPTTLQNTLVHATCIDLLPFPRIRDNLIENEGRFNWAELIEDLVGHLVDPFCFCGPQSRQDTCTSIAEEQAPYYGDEDDFTANRNGIIVWGAAHCPESWEVTAGFLRKWDLEGKNHSCDLYEISHRVRHEGPYTRY
ncbi:hypothetical protein VFPPC_03773 [Pochonia chlamydosporia 170]|uniref:Uncharacterized protein n=1 Tax=Pochonia chlamydosporia 170 TaxID=1380566 RepID=A0A179F348_METCM|nr:hypothetical protein VFPPC_03773 [Pochonia chlamydosporia 170]OAQ59539.1 hypothetical protein VFPPC_03773 [Pochonia chlamydosporia 170]